MTLPPEANPYSEPDEDALPPDLVEHLQKIASPANVAAYCSEGKWLPAWHLKVISRALVEAETDPEQSFLNLQVTVRGGKSELTSKWNVVWYLQRQWNRPLQFTLYFHLQQDGKHRDRNCKPIVDDQQRIILQRSSDLEQHLRRGCQRRAGSHENDAERSNRR